MINTIYNLLCSLKLIKANNDDEKEIYLYALDIVVYTAINAILILAFSLIFKCFFQSVLFIILFPIFQSTGGGYHANSHIGCIISTCSTWAIYVIFLKFIPANFIWLITIVMIVCIVIIINIAPIEHSNAPMTEREYTINKKRMLKLFLGLFTIQIILFFIFPSIYLLIAYIIILYFISVITAFLINKKNKTLFR